MDCTHHRLYAGLLFVYCHSLTHAYTRISYPLAVWFLYTSLKPIRLPAPQPMMTFLPAPCTPRRKDGCLANHNAV